jgi:hypothetical protein
MQEFLPFQRFLKVKNATVPCKHLERWKGIPYFETELLVR